MQILNEHTVGTKNKHMILYLLLRGISFPPWQKHYKKERMDCNGLKEIYIQRTTEKVKLFLHVYIVAGIARNFSNVINLSKP